MGPDLNASGRARGRGRRRAAPSLLLALLLAAVAIGCGGGGEAATSDSERAEDAAALNEALARELTLLDAYTRGRPLMRGELRALGRRFRAQQQEYADASVKAIRGLGERAEPPPEPVDLSEARTPRELLELLYGLEEAALAATIEDASRLHTVAPQSVNAWLASGRGEHLALIGRALGQN